MDWHFNIGAVAGVRLRVHWSIVLAPAYIAFLGYQHQIPWLQLAWLFVLLVCVFGCVLFHELGHALTARLFDIPTRDIVITPLGGFARLARRPRLPAQEFWITLAGPLVNLLIASVLGAWLLGLGSSPWPVPPLDGHHAFWKLLFWCNVVLFIVNLIPAFPMDGGRILRSLLENFVGRPKSTWIARRVGQFIALALIATGGITLQLACVLIGIVLLSATGLD